MPPTSDFQPLFAECKTVQDTNQSYRRGVEMLQEAHRLAMVKVVAEREAPLPRRAENDVSGSLKATQRSHDTLVRQWAVMEGIPFQRVSTKLRAMYDEAHQEER